MGTEPEFIFHFCELGKVIRIRTAENVDRIRMAPKKQTTSDWKDSFFFSKYGYP